MKQKTVLGETARTFVDAGKLVPDEITIGLVDEVLKQLGSQPFVLDGFPRTVPQAQSLEFQLRKYSMSVGRAIFLEVARDVLAARLSGRRVCKNCGATFHVQSKPATVAGVCDVCGGEIVQRDDDREDVVRTRLEAYDISTSPLREYYRVAGIYREIDGLGTTDEVFERLKLAAAT